MQKKTDFERMFPGFVAQPILQRHLVNLGQSYADYQRDQNSIKRIVQCPALNIEPDHKIRFDIAFASTQFSCDIIQEKMGDAFPLFVCPKRQDDRPSEELGVREIYDLYNTQRLEYLRVQLNDHIDLYTQSLAGVVDAAAYEAKMRRLGFPVPRFVEKQAWGIAYEIYQQVKYFAKELHISPRQLVKNALYKQQWDAQAAITPADRLMQINAPKGYAIMCQALEMAQDLEQFVEKYGTLHLDAQMKKTALDRKLAEFKKVTGFSLQEWKDLNLKWNMCTWPKPKNNKQR